jgi:hypothetical protein
MEDPTAKGPRTPEELQALIERGDAPIKREYLVPKKPPLPKEEEKEGEKAAPKAGERGGGRVDKQRTGKSHRQQKRERAEFKTSGNNVCQVCVETILLLNMLVLAQHNSFTHLRAQLVLHGRGGSPTGTPSYYDTIDKTCPTLT